MIRETPFVSYTRSFYGDFSRGFITNQNSFFLKCSFAVSPGVTYEIGSDVPSVNLLKVSPSFLQKFLGAVVLSGVHLHVHAQKPLNLFLHHVLFLVLSGNLPGVSSKNPSRIPSGALCGNLTEINYKNSTKVLSESTSEKPPGIP